MSTLVCPQSSALLTPLSNHHFKKTILGLGFVMALAIANTSCATLDPKLSASEQPARSLAISANVPTATLGSLYQASVSVSGGTPPYVFSTKGGNLPPGLSVNPTSGLISGTPQRSGSYRFMLSVRDSREVKGLKFISIRVKPLPVRAPMHVVVSPATANMSSGASKQFAAVFSNGAESDDDSEVTWWASAGTVTAEGLFTAPTVNLDTAIRLTATSKANSAKQGFATIRVRPAVTSSSSSLVMATSSLPSGTEGTPYTAALRASGGKTPYQWKLASGSLPAGIELNGPTGGISGLTSQTGTFSFTAVVSDASGQSVSRKLSISVTASSAGNFDGPAELPRVYVKSSLGDTPAPGTVHALKSGGNLQAALDSAKCGDTIYLEAGGSFDGAFVLPAKKCDDDHWVIIRTSAPDSALPPEGTRLTPCQAGIKALPGRPAYPCSSPRNVLAKIVFSKAGSGPLIMAAGANHYRLLGLEITRIASKNTVNSLALTETYGTADHIVFDRSWLHGTAQNETTRGIMLSGTTQVAVIDSFFSDFHCIAVSGACTDAQAIAGGLGDAAMGPYKIVNNFLEAAGENILFGGGPATRTPEDIEIRRNHFFKPLTWIKGQPGFVGGADSHPFIVKNLFELKNAQRVLLEGNVFENSWGGFTQVGSAMLLSPKNPGGCSVCLVRDVTIRYNKVSHAGTAMLIANDISDKGFTAQEGSHYSVHDMVFDDMNYEGCQGCNGVMFQITSNPRIPPAFWLHDVSIRNITVATDRAEAGWMIAGPAGQQNMVFQDSIIDAGTYGHVNAGGGAAQCYYGKSILKGILENCWFHYTFANNVIMGTHGMETWPTQNLATASSAAVGFVNWKGGSGGNYRLAASSSYKGKASDGRDPGADVDAVDAATAGVQ